MCFVGAELKSSRLSCDIVLRREGEAAVVAINYYPLSQGHFENTTP